MKQVLLFSILLISLILHSAEITGKVTSVSDGDTVTILDQLDNVKFRIRLAGIDAPEKAQPYGKLAKERLSDLILNQAVVIRFRDIDRYRRIIGTVYFNGQDMNLMMLQEGLAWHYSYYSDNETYSTTETEAKTLNKGLWQDKESVPPWDWRKLKRTK